MAVPRELNRANNVEDGDGSRKSVKALTERVRASPLRPLLRTGKVKASPTALHHRCTPIKVLWIGVG
jgi:hypothetical protein